MPSRTLHIVQAFEERDGGIVPVQPKVCPSAGSRSGRMATARSSAPDGYDP